VEDAVTSEGMGTGCTRAGEGMLAALGALNGAAVRFEHARQRPKASDNFRRRHHQAPKLP
jgi:hypothetical protein